MSRDGSSADHRKSFVRACFKITVARLNAVEGREGRAENWPRVGGKRSGLLYYSVV